MVRPGFTKLLSLEIRYAPNISYYLLVLVNKMVEVPALVCGQVSLGGTRCGRSYLGQVLAVVVVSTELH